MIKLGIYLAERGLIPDFILGFFIKKISLARVSSASIEKEKQIVINELKSGPIAEKTSDANDQHYEVPPAFFELLTAVNFDVGNFAAANKEKLPHPHPRSRIF